ncbi:MAG: ribonuclease Y [Clostridia bacterium]|nr:ribonuclease Y [Clostridia bacterium]
MNLDLLTVVIISIAVTTLGFYLGMLYRKLSAEKSIKSAEKEAEKIVSTAKEVAETRKKEVILEGKEEVHRFRNDTEKELSERRKDIQRQENRILRKEENLDKKIENLESKENDLNLKEKEMESKYEEIEVIKEKQLKALEKISGLSISQAKSFLLESLQSELSHEKAQKIHEFEQKIKEECGEKAEKILAQAIQRCSAEHVAEATISVVNLPNDDMKGRIIGREGRNIRAIENLTGVDLIIDDTPESITLSAFDPVRREIARVALERLIIDGRIHPAKIEEMVERAKRDIEKEIKDAGQRACMQLGINNLHPEIVKLLGKLKYRTSYGQNVLNHSLEVAHLCSMMASELGLDSMLARRIGLLHDIGKALDHEIEGSHIELGVSIAKKHKENEEVIHAINSHHGDIEPKTPYDFILQAADTISAARPGARREDLQNYIKRLEKLETVVSSFDGVKNCYAIQAGREVRVMVNPEAINDDQMVLVARDICKKIESDLEYPGQIKVNMIRESRAIDYAK